MSSPERAFNVEIPAEESLFYGESAGREWEQLARLDSIGQLLAMNQSASATTVARLALSTDRARFPYPRPLWMCAKYDCLSERDALAYLAPLAGKCMLQIGGQGHHAVQFMLGGAREAWLLTPVEAEAHYAQELARLTGVEIHYRVGVAEEMPFAAGSFDAIYASGCAHHFETEKAFPEIARVLVAGGRFSAVDPWKAPFYAWGIRAFGKREAAVNCRPLDAKRLTPLTRSFRKSIIIQHGTLTRYPMIALRKLRIDMPYWMAWRLTQFDDALASLLGLRRFGSSVAVMAET